MSFWEKLFGKKDTNQISDKTDSHLNGHGSELTESGLPTMQDLQNLIKPIIRTATRLDIQKPSRPPENSQLRSQFGGQSYFEKGENWPTTKSGKYLDFIFQVFSRPDIEVPASIKLIQFYYNWDEFPWDTENDGWLVKIYKSIA